MISFDVLMAFLAKTPAVQPLSHGVAESGHWWVKLAIDIDHEMAWRVVQELAHVLNYLSLNQPLPTVFKPVSPPVYLNGGPRLFLSWVIETTQPDFSPDKCEEWLRGRLPRPVDDPAQWALDEE